MVAAGPSLDDPNGYFLIRAFDDLADRERREDRFYSSPEWREGPREAVIEKIEVYTDAVVELDEDDDRGPAPLARALSSPPLVRRRRRSPGTRRGRRGCGGETRRSPRPGRGRSRRRSPGGRCRSRARGSPADRARRGPPRPGSARRRACRPRARRDLGRALASRSSAVAVVASRTRIARLARSSRSPASWRDAASRAAGLSRSRTRRSESSSRAAADDGPPARDAHPLRTARQRRRVLRPVRHDELRGGGGSGGAHVRGEIRERDVHLVPDAAHDRQVCATTARTTRSSLNDQRSSIEPPPRATIVSAGASSARPASARVGDVLLDPPQRAHDRLGRAVALDLARDEHHPNERPPPREHVADVLPRRSRRRRHDRDDLGRAGSARFRSVANSPSAVSFALSCSNWIARSPTPLGWIESTYSCSAPCASYTSTRPWATTRSPVWGWNGDRTRSSRNHTHWSWARSSFSAK